jgi:UV DNA damage endonuclease
VTTMKIGYPCNNLRLPCSAARTFRLASYSAQRLSETVEHNLACLRQILEFNIEHGIYFFRISSDTVPFASHPICDFPWYEQFAPDLRALGDFIKQHQMRISMHPDQFVLLNAQKASIIHNSIAELEYHATLLDLMGLDATAKIQIHVGGIYGNKQASMERFIEQVRTLPLSIRTRLVIENDDRLFSLQDCLTISDKTTIPILLDVFHHHLNHNGESLPDAISSARDTWSPSDGRLMIDYSSQQAGKRTGAHADTLDIAHFNEFLAAMDDTDVDIMLEIKDKEASALQAIAAVRLLKIAR